jgi:hypothetical protein
MRPTHATAVVQIGIPSTAVLSLRVGNSASICSTGVLKEKQIKHLRF